MYLCTPHNSYGQRASGKGAVSMNVQPKSGTMDDLYQLSIQLDGTQKHQAPLVSPSADFEIAGTSSGPSAHLERNGLTVKMMYNYTLVPQREGVLVTPTVQIVVNGKKHVLKGLKVKIGKGLSTEQTYGKDILLRQTVDKESVYLGEQVVNTIQLLTHPQLLDLHIDTPNYEGFWNKVLGKDSGGSTVLRGKRYETYKMRRFDGIPFVRYI